MYHHRVFTANDRVPITVVTEAIQRSGQDGRKFWSDQLHPNEEIELLECRLVYPGEVVGIVDKIELSRLDEYTTACPRIGQAEGLVRSHFFGEFPLCLKDSEKPIAEANYCGKDLTLLQSWYALWPRTVAYSMVFNDLSCKWDTKCFICVEDPEEWQNQFAHILTSPLLPRSRVEALILARPEAVVSAL